MREARLLPSGAPNKCCCRARLRLRWLPDGPPRHAQVPICFSSQAEHHLSPPHPAHLLVIDMTGRKIDEQTSGCGWGSGRWEDRQDHDARRTRNGRVVTIPSACAARPPTHLPTHCPGLRPGTRGGDAHVEGVSACITSWWGLPPVLGGAARGGDEGKKKEKKERRTEEEKIFVSVPSPSGTPGARVRGG